MSEKMQSFTEPFKIKTVEPLKKTTEEFRKKILEEAGYNPFKIRSEDVFIDFLTDSGTGAMSDRQWAGMMKGDEGYAGSSSWLRLEKVAKSLTGMEHILPVHQGRAAENILYGILGGEDRVFISNTHFDTTRANIEQTGAETIDIPCKEADDLELEAPFKGNIDTKKLEQKVQSLNTASIAGIVMTITNNSAGGQPVSMANMEAVRNICDQHDLRLIVDGCRIAENSYFVQQREEGYSDKTSEEIAQQMLRLSDVFVMSAKKDGMVNMGGLLTLKDERLSKKCKNKLILSEGFTSYGGMSGRNMEALATGLQEVFREDYLQYRIESTGYLATQLKEKGVPLVWPAGGHAVYIDAGKLYSNIPPEQFPGQMLVADLYVKGGIRSAEMGSAAAGTYNDQGTFVPADHELVRLAIPKRVYTQSHFDYVANIFDDILEMSDRQHGLKFTYEPATLKVFTAQFAPAE